MTAASAVLGGLDGIRQWQEDLYRDLHRHPELGLREHETGTKVAAQLTDAGFDVRTGIGGTGVVGILENGDGPTVLVRADMDALPILETSGVDYASTVTVRLDDGSETPVAHTCGHDMHTACLVGAARLLADAREHWSGTLIALFQPAEETGEGARAMLDDGLADLIPKPDVALAQHVLRLQTGHVATRGGPVLSAADSIRITLHGRGAHGSMPHASIDPVVLAAMIVVRLQTIVSRETAPGEPAVVTVGSLQAGGTSNIIPETAQLLLNIRTYTAESRVAILDAIRRIVDAECAASGAPEPDYEFYDQFPLTENDPDATRRVTAAFAEHFGDRLDPLERQSASEDFSHIPHAFGAPYTYWGFGGFELERTDPWWKWWGTAVRAEDIPVNHSGDFAPITQPTLDTGTEALVVAALAWLAD